MLLRNNVVLTLSFFCFISIIIFISLLTTFSKDKIFSVFKGINKHVLTKVSEAEVYKFFLLFVKVVVLT